MLRHACAALVLLAGAAHAHDPDTTGGLYRSLDGGANWAPINPGIFPSGALALAADPRDANRLLLATDSGVWQSQNGGRDWQLDASPDLRGPAFGAAFDTSGRALVASGSRLLRNDGDGWRVMRAPAGALPARALIASGPGAVYLVGRSGLWRSDDFGGAWRDAGAALGAQVTNLVATPGAPDRVHAIAGGNASQSTDGARTWRRLGAIDGGVDALALDGTHAARVWAAGGGRIHRSEDGGRTWQALGAPLPEAAARARTLMVAGDVVLVATDRGLFRSGDAGAHWDAPKEALPAHLAASVLLRDAAQPQTLYAGFALARYDDLVARLPPEPASWTAWFTQPGALAGLGGAIVLAGAVGWFLRSRRSAPRAGDASLAKPVADPQPGR